MVQIRKNIRRKTLEKGLLFTEKFKNDSDGKVRKNEHIMYMPDTQQIVDEAQACGFIVEAKADLLKCQYEYQYLYMFVKPM